MKMDTGYLNLFFLHRYVSLNKTFLPMKRLVLIPTIFALIGRPINAATHGDMEYLTECEIQQIAILSKGVDVFGVRNSDQLL